MSVFLDNYYALRFVYLLTRAWKDTEAFKLGIIDNKGKQIIKRQDFNSEQKDAYTKFHTLVFNIKKLLEKIPLGKTTVARYAAALYLIREHIESTVENENIITEKFIEFASSSNLLAESLDISELFAVSESNSTKYIIEDTTTGGVDMVDGGLKKPLADEEEHFAGHRVFKCDSDTFHKCRLGKSKYARYKTYVGEDEIGNQVRDYGRKNPKKGIIIKDSASGAMLFLRRQKQD